MMKNETFMKIVFAIVLGVLVYVIITSLREHFSDFNGQDFSRSRVHTKYLTSEHNNYITNGSVYKHYHDGQYQYLYKFNLPIAIGGDYNNVKGQYIALAGLTKDELKPVGELMRSSDGWYYLQMITKDNYKYIQIMFSTDDKKANVVLFDSEI